MRNLKVIMAFKGSNYHGFQRQNGVKTVQQTVEEAVGSVLNEKVTIFGCSRTDKGVHANEYCFNLKTENQIRHRNFLRGINDRLPDDISLISCEDAELDFHARYDTTAKEYVYLIHNSESKNPFTRDLSLHYRRPMDIEKMRQAAKHYLGTHDFLSFCSQNGVKENTVRTIYKFDIEKDGNTVKMTICGDGFLYNMIRIMVGTLFWVNEGRLEPDDIPAIIEKRDRIFAGRTALAHGLYLNKVFY